MNEYYPEGWLKESFTNKSRMMSLSAILKAKEENLIMESVVIMCDSFHNMTVDLGIMKGIIPRVEGAVGIEEGKTKDIALISRVGRPVCFTVSEIKTDEFGKPYALLSRRNAQQLCINNYINNLNSGDIVNARITHLESFGAFCDIGCGNVALMPIDFISVSRISHPSDRFFIGQNIKAIISKIDSDGRITLSHKELLGTWEENAELFNIGQTVSGIVRSVEDYGIFIELTPNLAGLAEPKAGVTVGETASVYIKNIIREKMKIKLIIIDTFAKQKSNQFDYFYNGDSISEFYYSPSDCTKQIYTVFK